MLTNITIKYFPPNTTSVLQPLDQGIINNFKTIYRTKYVNKLIAQMDALEVIEEKLNVKDLLMILFHLGCKLKKKTINYFFKKAGFVSQLNEENDEDERLSVYSTSVWKNYM